MLSFFTHSPATSTHFSTLHFTVPKLADDPTVLNIVAMKSRISTGQSAAARRRDSRVSAWTSGHHTARPYKHGGRATASVPYQIQTEPATGLSTLDAIVVSGTN